ncbi:hypothetical protein Tco_0336179 [Tanacetum coccineum]
MSSTVNIMIGYGIQSNAEVLGYEEEISRGIFAFRETDAGYYDIPLYSRFKQVEYKGVPHPLSGDYTPREQEDIDDSLDGEQGAVSDHSVNDDPIHDHIPKPSIEQRKDGAIEAALYKQKGGIMLMLGRATHLD